MKFIKVHYRNDNRETYISVNAIQEIAAMNTERNGIKIQYTNIFLSHDCLEVKETPKEILCLIKIEQNCKQTTL